MEKLKIHFLWIGFILALVILAIIFIPNLNKQKCNSPYIKFGTSCCLDKNSNNICDNDERIVELQDSCGDGLCQSNEKAPDCSDCKPNIRIENLQYKIFKPTFTSTELKITDYHLVQMGDSVRAYPTINIYQGTSEQQCQDKNLMSLFKESLLCPEDCSYLINKDIDYLTNEESSYRTHSYKLDDLNLTYSCIYFIFELKPYHENGNASELKEIQSIAKEESQIIIVNYPYKSKLEIKNEQQ